jgi:hypothetical protein
MLSDHRIHLRLDAVLCKAVSRCVEVEYNVGGIVCNGDIDICGERACVCLARLALEDPGSVV